MRRARRSRCIGRRSCWATTTRGVRATGSAEIRCTPWASACEAGLVYVKKAPWTDAFLDEVCHFPRATHDDQVIAAAGAFNELVVTVGEVYTVPLNLGG